MRPIPYFMRLTNDGVGLHGGPMLLLHFSDFLRGRLFEELIMRLCLTLALMFLEPQLEESLSFA